jgi:hypothetical protein
MVCSNVILTKHCNRKYKSQATRKFTERGSNREIDCWDNVNLSKQMLKSTSVIAFCSHSWLKSPYFMMALPLVAMFGILVCAFEILIPWDTEVKVWL